MIERINKGPKTGCYFIRVRLWPNYGHQDTTEVPVSRQEALEIEKEFYRIVREEKARDQKAAKGIVIEDPKENLKTVSGLIQACLKDFGPAGIPLEIWQQIERNHGHSPSTPEGLKAAYDARMNFLALPYNPCKSKDPKKIAATPLKHYAAKTINMNKQIFYYIIQKIAYPRGLIPFIPFTIKYEQANKRNHIRTPEEIEKFDRVMLELESPLRFAIWVMEKNKIRPEQLFELPKIAYIEEIDRIVLTHTKTGIESAYIELPSWFARYYKMIPESCPYLFPKLWYDCDNNLRWAQWRDHYHHLEMLIRRAGIRPFTLKDLNHEALTFMVNKYDQVELENLGHTMTDEVRSLYFHKDHLKVERKPDREESTLLQFRKRIA